MDEKILFVLIIICFAMIVTALTFIGVAYYNEEKAVEKCNSYYQEKLKTCRENIIEEDSWQVYINPDNLTGSI